MLNFRLEKADLRLAMPGLGESYAGSPGSLRRSPFGHHYQPPTMAPAIKSRVQQLDTSLARPVWGDRSTGQLRWL